MLWLCLYKQGNICMSFLCISSCITTCQSEKKYTWNCSKILGIFHFFYELFYENINQEHNLGMPDCAFGPFTYVCCKNCMSGFSTFVLNLSKSGNILLRNYLFSSASLLLVGEIAHWCMNFEWWHLLSHM